MIRKVSFTLKYYSVLYIQNGIKWGQVRSSGIRWSRVSFGDVRWSWMWPGVALKGFLLKFEVV